MQTNKMQTTHNIKKLFSVAAVVTAFAACQGVGHARNLVANGNFQKGGNNAAEGWPAAKDGISYPSENGNRFLRITSTAPGKNVTMYHPVPIPKNTEALKMTFRARWKDVEVGAQNWFDARVMMEFKDFQHGNVRGAPGAPNFKGSSDGWQTRELAFAVPKGAAFLALMPSLFQAKGGTLDIDDLVLEPMSAAQLNAQNAAKKRAEEEARKSKLIVSTLLPIPSGTKSAPLKVQGNRLVSMKDGKEVWLQGVAIASLEWAAAGENILKSTDHALNVWGVNVDRKSVV